MSGIKTKELFFEMADILATYQLLQYVKKDDTALRKVVGVTMAGLGYGFGPSLEEKLSTIGDEELTDAFKQRMIYTAGGVALGGAAGYFFKKEHGDVTCTTPLGSTIKERLEIARPDSPNPLFSFGSTVWLMYSLALRERTEETKIRQAYGLGAGAIGYLWGPELIGKVGDLVIPKDVKDDILEVQARGAAMVGGLLGGAAAWYMSKNYVRTPDALPDQAA